MKEVFRKQKTRPGFEKAFVFTGLVIAGIILDALGAFFANRTGFPVYLDVIGTMLASILGGYVPGIIVGLAGPLITTLTTDPTAISYTMLKVLIAIITAFFFV